MIEIGENEHRHCSTWSLTGQSAVRGWVKQQVPQLFLALPLRFPNLLFLLLLHKIHQILDEASSLSLLHIPDMDWMIYMLN